MFARTRTGHIAESTSFDGARTWTPAVENDLPNASTRLFLARTPSGNVLLINNDDSRIRRRMTLYLSEDDGATWKYRRCIDERDELSYPDADFYDGKIYLTYDRERTGAKEILFACFTEEDIKDPTREVSISIVSKP